MVFLIDICLIGYWYRVLCVRVPLNCPSHMKKNWFWICFGHKPMSLFTPHFGWHTSCAYFTGTCVCSTYFEGHLNWGGKARKSSICISSSLVIGYRFFFWGWVHYIFECRCVPLSFKSAKLLESCSLIEGWGLPSIDHLQLITNKNIWNPSVDQVHHNPLPLKFDPTTRLLFSRSCFQSFFLLLFVEKLGSTFRPAGVAIVFGGLSAFSKKPGPTETMRQDETSQNCELEI